jgi:hypothetical protein
MHARRPNDDLLTAAVTIRRLGDGEKDRMALDRLVERDSAQALERPVLVAEVEGNALAAISLVNGKAVADPFSRTTELRSLLELRAYQLRRRESGKRRSRSERRHGRARAALAGSPPGGGGRLLELPRWG